MIFSESSKLPILRLQIPNRVSNSYLFPETKFSFFFRLMDLQDPCVKLFCLWWQQLKWDTLFQILFRIEMNNLARCFVTLVLTVSFLIASEYFFCYLILHFSFILIVLLHISTHRFSISTQGPDEQVNWLSVQPVQKNC